MGLWLLACAALVLSMVWLGGVTRLTRSGLSIVEWKPVTGVLPPLGEAAWAAELERYRQTPEAKLVNVQMGLEAFRSIYYVEYAHRLLGRLTFAAFFAPLAWFWRRGRLSPAVRRSLLLLLGLGGLQGVVGWWMVKSGLVDVPRVSPYRLAIHLALALALLSGLLWLSLDQLGQGDAPGPRPGLRAASRTTLALVSLTLFWGALTAGMHAGLVCPTFPLMFGSLLPPGLSQSESPLRAMVSDPMAVQFAHRALAFASATGSLIVAALGASAPGPARTRALGLLAAVSLQITLGALVVMRSVPVSLASLHQANGALVLALVVSLVHASRPIARRASLASGEASSEAGSEASSQAGGSGLPERASGQAVAPQ